MCASAFFAFMCIRFLLRITFRISLVIQGGSFGFIFTTVFRVFFLDMSSILVVMFAVYILVLSLKQQSGKTVLKPRVITMFIIISKYYAQYKFVSTLKKSVPQMQDTET